MAFGDVLSTGSNNTLNIPASFSPAAAVTVAVGNLIVVFVVEQTSLTVTGVTDNLGNSYSAFNAGTLGGSSSGRAFWSLATVAGSSTPVAACTSSAHNASIDVAVYEGPFAASPLDANPANTVDTSSPYTSPLTGTLAQADELLVAYYMSSSGTAWSAPSQGSISVQAAAASANGCIVGAVVAATTSTSIDVTQTSVGNAMQGIGSFKQAAADTLFAQGCM